VQLCAEVQKGWPVGPLLRAMTPTLSRQALCAAPGELGEQIAVGRYLVPDTAHQNRPPNK